MKRRRYQGSWTSLWTARSHPQCKQVQWFPPWSRRRTEARSSVKRRGVPRAQPSHTDQCCQIRSAIADQRCNKPTNEVARFQASLGAWLMTACVKYIPYPCGRLLLQHINSVKDQRWLQSLLHLNWCIRDVCVHLALISCREVSTLAWNILVQTNLSMRNHPALSIMVQVGYFIQDVRKVIVHFSNHIFLYFRFWSQCGFNNWRTYMSRRTRIPRWQIHRWWWNHLLIVSTGWCYCPLISQIYAVHADHPVTFMVLRNKIRRIQPCIDANGGHFQYCL